MTLDEIAIQLRDLKDGPQPEPTRRREDVKIILIYAFNATGKTRLSVAYKDATKENGQHVGVYFNAYSEDLFVWDNENDLRLEVRESSLNQFHSYVTEDDVRNKLQAFRPTYNFEFRTYEDDLEKGIKYISFFLSEDEDRNAIKISRGEERIFVWCFFLALFEVEGWSDKQSSHFFIDDPVSSLDDHNIFITASTLYDLIEKHYKNRKIIVTTHHYGFYSILANGLTKGEKSARYKGVTQKYFLSLKSGALTLESEKKDVALYHLRLLQMLDVAPQEQVYTYHFALMRQVLETISSFLGKGMFSYVLEQIGIADIERVAQVINARTHQNIYSMHGERVSPDDEAMFRRILVGIKTKYNFAIHVE